MPTVRTITAWFLGGGLFLLSLPLQAGSPFAGEPLYKTHCARCHGGAGVRPLPGAVDFSNRGAGHMHFLNQPDQPVLERIERGRGSCPSFRGLLNDQDILNIIAYMRTVN